MYFNSPFPERCGGVVPSVWVVSPDDGGGDFGTEEDAQVADGVGGEHADDGEGNREVPIQRIRALCRGSKKHTRTVK